MHDAPEGGGEFEGIDPTQLTQLMKSMTGGTGNARPLLYGYFSQFAYLGLDSTRLNKLATNYTWSDDQQPMLQRRNYLTMQQPSDQWINGMGTAGASYLDFNSQAQASAAGTAAAKQFQDGKISEDQLFALMSQYQDDPDWQTALVKQLGPDGIRELEDDGSATPNDVDGTSNREWLALAVAAAMNNGVNFRTQDTDQDEKNSEDPTILAPLLQYANFPPQVLATLGAEVMAPGYISNGDAQLVFSALANDPQAAAMFVQQNAQDLVEWIGVGDHSGGMPDDLSNTIQQVISAGTITAKDTSPQLAANAVTALVTATDSYVGPDNSHHLPEAFEVLYGQIVQTWWPDVVYSVTSPAVGPNGVLTSPGGLKLSAGQWSTFVDEAMRDPKSGADLLAYSQAQVSELQKEAANQPGQYGGSNLQFQAGLVSAFFNDQARNAYNSMGDDKSAWAEAVHTAIEQTVSGAAEIAPEVILEPEAAPEIIGIKLTATIVADVINSFNTDTSPANNAPTPNYTTWQSNYSNAAVDAFQSGSNGPAFVASKPGLQSLIDSAKNYDGGSFVAKMGNPSAMTPQQLQAYNQWLTSPDVVAYVLQEGPYASFVTGESALQDTVTAGTGAGHPGG